MKISQSVIQSESDQIKAAPAISTNANSNNFVDFLISKLLLNKALVAVSSSTVSLNDSNAYLKLVQRAIKCTQISMVPSNKAFLRPLPNHQQARR